MGSCSLQNSSLPEKLVKLGIVVALSEELKSLTDKKIESGSFLKLNNDIFLSLSGTGPDHAAKAAKDLVEQGVNALLSWGCAASLTGELESGSLLIPKQVECENGIVLPVDIEWHNRLYLFLSEKLQPQKGRLLESKQIVPDPDKKKWLHKKSGAIAVDMESASIAKVAQKNDLSFLAVRAIADTVNRQIPQCILNSVDYDGQIRKLYLFKQSILHPVDWVALAKLGHQFSAAKKTLKMVAAISPPNFFARNLLMTERRLFNDE